MGFKLQPMAYDTVRAFLHVRVSRFAPRDVALEVGLQRGGIPSSQHEVET